MVSRGRNTGRMLDTADTIEFCDKLNGFRTCQKYHDLTILVEGETFACHKIILASSSAYFDTMFGGDFHESKTDKITLHTLNAETFEQILSFMYSREIKINSKNVTDLLMASHFFDMSRVEELCLQYIRLRFSTLSPENVLEVLQFAVNTNKCHPTLVLKLCVSLTSSNYWYDGISMLSECSFFTEISFPILHTILQWVDYACDGDEIVEGVLRWLNYKLDDRIKMLPEIIEMIEFATTDAPYLKRLLEFATKYQETAVASSSKLICCDKRNSRNIFSSLQVCFLNNNKSIPYLGTLALDYKNLEWKCYSKRYRMTFINDNDDFGYENLNKFHIAGTVSGDYLYQVFSEKSYKSPKFVYSSTRNIFRQIRLKDPQMRSFDYFDLCSDQDNVYLTYQVCSPRLTVSTYVYRSEPNEWSLLPKCSSISKSKKSILVPCNNALYLFGLPAGEDSCKRHSLSVCRYDSRTFKWQELPCSPSVLPARTNLAACAFNEKLYASYGDSDTVIAFDPVANKWNLKAPKMKEYIGYEFSMVTYHDLIWAIGRTNGDDEVYGVEVYNPKTNLWSNFKSPDAAMGLKISDRDDHYKMFAAINIHSSK